MCEQGCQPPVDCEEKSKFDTVHGEINATNEVVPKAVNLDYIWTLAKEKEASGKLARDDGIGDEWSSTFYKLILKIVGNVPDTPQVLLQNL